MTEDGFRSDGWRQMLAIYIARPLDTAIDRAGQAYTYTELYTDPAKKAAWEQSVLDQLPGLVDRQTDGDTQFFLNFAITLQKPEPPQSIKDELIKQQAAVAAAKAAQAEAEAREAAALAQVEVEKAEAQKIQARVDVLGQQGFLQQYAIDHGLNPFQPSTNSLITGEPGADPASSAQRARVHVRRSERRVQRARLAPVPSFAGAQPASFAWARSARATSSRPSRT